MEKGTRAHETKLDVCISVLKLLHASQVRKLYGKMENETAIILNKWKKSGVSNTVSRQIGKENPFEE